MLFMLKFLRAAVAITASCAVLASCRDDDVVLPVTVIVPPEIAAIPSGVLRLSLWTYDPLLADAPATLADADSVRFAHTAGTQDSFRMHVEGRVPGGMRHYITIRGFELTAECEKYILWDGIEGTGAPRTVVMRAVPAPGCSG